MTHIDILILIYDGDVDIVTDYCDSNSSQLPYYNPISMYLLGSMGRSGEYDDRVSYVNWTHYGATSMEYDHGGRHFRSFSNVNSEFT